MTPVSSSASPAARTRPRRCRGSRRRRSRSPGGRRSPGAAMPRPFGPSRPTASIRSPSIATSPGTRRPSTSAASTPSLMPDRPPHDPVGRGQARRAPSARRYPRDRQTIATFASPSARSSASSTSLVGGAGRERDDPPHARAQLVVRGDDVDHQVAEGLAEPDHRHGRDRVEHELLRGAGLEPRRAGERPPPPTTTATSWSASAPSSEPSTQTTRDRQRLREACLLEGAEHVGRPPARADPDDGVVAPRPERAHLRGLPRRRRPRRAPGRRRSRRRRRRARRPGPARSRRSTRSHRRRRARGARTCPCRRRRAGRRARSRAPIASIAATSAGGLARRRRAPRRRPSFISVDELVRRAEIEIGARGIPRLGREGLEARLVAQRLHLCQSMHAVVEWSRPMLRMLAEVVWICRRHRTAGEAPERMATIALERVTKVYGNGFLAVDDVSLDDRATASSSCSSDRPAAASRRSCG